MCNECVDPGKSVLILEKLSKIGAKLKGTYGGRCNLTDTLSNEYFMARCFYFFYRGHQRDDDILHGLCSKCQVELRIVLLCVLFAGILI